jgi:hypothetical protein
MPIRYTVEEYFNLSKDLIGSLVTLNMGTLGDGENSGVGVVVSHRRWYGCIHVYVHWFSSPYFNFKFERQVGWHEYERLTILSKPRRT